MPFDDYKSRTWLVKKSDLPECEEGHHVRFVGRRGDVTVKCNGTETYRGGKYEESSDAIQGGDYTIAIIARTPKYKIKLIKDDPKRLSGGSWTAEDHSQAPEKG